MRRRDIVNAIWKMGRGIHMGEWVEAIADEFVELQARIVKLEKELAKRELPAKGKRA